MTAGERSLSVLVTPAGLEELDVEGHLVVVIDVLRACTTLAHALDAGARGVIPVETVEEATRLAASLGRGSTLLGGERHSKRVEGFDLGNSPAEYDSPTVAERTIVLSTTNGARALARSKQAKECVAAALVTRRAVARRALGFDRVLIVCAGQDGYFSFEDFLCAGLLIEAMTEEGPGKYRLRDGARAALEMSRRQPADLFEVLRGTDHGRELVAGGFEGDLRLAGDLDRFAFVPVLRDGRLVAVDPGEAQTPR